MYVVVLVVFAQAILTGSRGPLFSASSVIFVGFALVSKRRIPLSKAYAFMICVGVGALLMLGFRSVLYLGNDRPEAPGIVEALTMASQVRENVQSTGSTGNEFVFHGAALETVDSKHKYDFGLNWIYALTLNPVPRILWPEKPYRFETPGVHWEDIQEVTGLAVLGSSVMHAEDTPDSARRAIGGGAASGAAPGIVADIYMQFGPLSALVFYLMGRYLQKLHVSAAALHSPFATCSYIMLFAISLNGFAQEIYAIFVPFAYAMAPVALFQVLGTRRNRTGRRFTPLARRLPEASPATPDVPPEASAPSREGVSSGAR
jgi:hypothetical protein